MHRRVTPGLLVLLVAAGSAAAGSGPEGLRLALRGAVPVCGRGPATARDLHDLQIDLVRHDNGWATNVWGFTPYIPGLDHTGALTAAQATPDGVRFSVRVDILSCKRAPVFLGGRAEFEIELSFGGSATTGVFRGRSRPIEDPEVLSELETAWGYGPGPERTARHLTLAGRLQLCLMATNVQGRVERLPWRACEPAAGLPVVHAGEHPRLLFRPGERARLRELAATERGRGLIEAMEQLPAAAETPGPMQATVRALLYQLTGNVEHAAAARNALWDPLFVTRSFGHPTHHAHALLATALAYDLCRDAWCAEDRGVFYGFMEQQVRQIAQRHDRRDELDTGQRFQFRPDMSSFVFSPDDTGCVAQRSAAAVCALAILGDSPEAYAVLPVTDIPVCPPAVGFRPWFGVPVVPFESDVMPRRWLLNGPFPQAGMDSIVADAGGFAALRPEPGDVLRAEGVALDWRPYAPVEAAGKPPGFSARQASGGTYDVGAVYAPAAGPAWKRARKSEPSLPLQAVLLFTVIANDVERIVECLPNWRGGAYGIRMWVAGRETRDGDLLRLTPGLYPLLVSVPLLGGHSVHCPRLADFTADDYGRALSAWAAARRAGGHGRGLDSVYVDLVAMARSIQRWAEAEVARGGWGFRCHEFVLPFLLMYRNVLGVDLAADLGLDRLIETACRIRPHAPTADFDNLVALCYHLLPPAARRTAGGYLGRYGLGLRRPLDAFLALANVPEVLPSASVTMLGPFAGHFESVGVQVFSAGNDDSDPCAMLFAGGSGEAARCRGGGFVLHGYGGYWGEWTLPVSVADRRVNGIVLKGLYPAAIPAVTRIQAHGDGSGCASVRLDRFLRGAMVRDDSPGSPGLRFETEAAPVRGVSWIRSLAVDYSGLCGAPALVAVADRVRAADPVEKAWRINLGEATLATQGRNPLPGTLTMERDGFRFAPPGRKAYLRATVAAPASVQFRVDRQGGDPRQTCVDAFVDPQATLAQAAASAMSRAMLEETPVGGLYGAMKSERPSTVDAIGLIGDVRKRIEHEASGAMDTTFLVVLTLQAGEAPRVERVETERGVAVKIGNRLVRFDGEALTLGDP